MAEVTFLFTTDASPPKDRPAPLGQVWVCGACGKTAKDPYGDEGGWDESCTINAVLCFESKVFNAKGEYVWKAV